MLGRRVVGVEIRRADVCTTHDGSPVTPAALLLEQVVAGTLRRGKELALVGSSGGIALVHLGMSGQLTHGGAAADHVHVVWHLEDGGQVRFRDPRRFGGVWTFPSTTALHQHRWDRLGPDALDADGTHLHAAAGRSRRAIKAVLLDQRVLAGVGNIYADEALFEAGIRPSRPACRVSRAGFGRLAEAVVDVLSRAVDAGGSTLRDYVDGQGQRGSAQLTLMAYGRSGAPCRRCGRPLKGTRLAQRATVYCPRCQR